MQGTEGNFSADKDCVFVRPESSSLNDEVYMEQDFGQQDKLNGGNIVCLNDISEIEDFL